MQQSDGLSPPARHNALGLYTSPELLCHPETYGRFTANGKRRPAISVSA